MPYLILTLAIVAETIGTTALQASQQFTRLGPTVLAIVTYAVSIYFLGLALKFMPMGIAYAIWSGLGIVLIAGFGYLAFRQTLDLPAIIGIALILIGILVIHLFSTSEMH
jgi:small multidrug resistance pump